MPWLSESALDPLYEDPAVPMEHNQGMSPTHAASAVLEGEVSGPSYGAVTTPEPPGLQVDAQLQESMVNGVVREPPLQSSEPQTLQPVSDPSSGGVLQASEVVTLEHAVLPEAEPQPSGATSVPVVENVFTHVGQRVEVGGFEFSPPEELPRSFESSASEQRNPVDVEVRGVCPATREPSRSHYDTNPGREAKIYHSGCDTSVEAVSAVFTRGRTCYGAVGPTSTAYAYT